MEDALEITTAGRFAEGAASLDFERLVPEYQQRIYRILLGLLRDSEAADNLTQECFVRAYEKRTAFRGEASVATWLISIAINLARDHARNRRAGFWRRLFSGPGEEREQALASASDRQPSAEERLIASQQLSQVWEVVDSLSPRQREVFLLRFVEEMPLEQIAEIAGMQVGTVKAHLSRAVTTVRQRMREHGTGTTSERR
jgi:RNA polymerase sigma-70 factor, ECF subfamily